MTLYHWLNSLRVQLLGYNILKRRWVKLVVEPHKYVAAGFRLI